MKNLADMKNLELARSVVYLPKMKTKNNGNAIYLTSDSFIKNKNNIANINFKNMNFYRSYFLDYIYKFTILNVKVRKILDTKKFYSEVIESTDVTKTYKKLNMYKNNNIFIDLYFFHKLYLTGIDSVRDMKVINEEISGFETEFYTQVADYLNESYNGEEYEQRILLEKFVGKKVLDGYYDLLMMIYNKYSTGFATNTLLYNVDDWNDNYTNTTIFSVNKARSPITILCALMKNDIEKFKSIPFDIVIKSSNMTIKLIPSECIVDSVETLKLLLRKLSKNISDTDLVVSNDKETEEDSLEKESKLENDSKELPLTVSENINNKIENSFKQALVYSFTGEEIQQDLSDTIDDTVDEVYTKIKDADDDITEVELEKKVEDSLNTNPAFLKALESIKTESITGSISSANTKRNELLAQKQMEIKINKSGKTINEILKETKEKQLKSKRIKTNTINEEMKDSKFVNFTSSYNTELLEKDTIAILNFFKEKRIPVYILDIQKEDTSDNFTKKFTYTVKMESYDRKRHTLKFDMPKFIDNSFMYINGNKKNIITQFLLNPIAKTGPDTVQLCSNYNKIFLTRVGTKLSPKIEKFKKNIVSNKQNIPLTKLNYTTGDNVSINIKYKTTIEFDDLSSYFTIINVNGTRFYFNVDSINEEALAKKIKLKNDVNLLPIAIRKNEIIYLNTDSNVVMVDDNKLTLVDYISSEIDKISPGFEDSIKQTTVGKKYMYTQATIMKKHIPIILILAYLEGLTSVLKKAEIKYEFSDKRPKTDNLDDIVIRFNDGYLICNNEPQPISNALLLNGLSSVATEEYNFEDFDKKETYLNIFAELYNNRMILNAFENFYDLFIDPITLEVLNDLNMPTDFVNLVLYGNKLLEDNQYVPEKEMSHYRMRNNELVNGYLYKTLATAYSNYRSSAANRNPAPFTIPQDQVLKEIVMSNIVEDYSTLNPVLEAEKLRAATFKGLSGLNQERAYTEEKRSYDKTMKGIFAMSSPPTGSVGIVRQMAMDVNVLSPRGYLQITDENHLENLNSSNMFCPSELLTTTCAQRDDAQRVAMECRRH